MWLRRLVRECTVSCSVVVAANVKFQRGQCSGLFNMRMVGCGTVWSRGSWTHVLRCSQPPAFLHNHILRALC